MTDFPINLLEEFTDDENDIKARFDAAVLPLRPYDDIEHPYTLTNGKIQLLALISLAQGHTDKDERYLVLAGHLLTLFVRKHPDLKPHIDKMLEVLGVLDKAKSH